MKKSVQVLLAVCALLATPALAQTAGQSPYFETLYKALPHGTYEAHESWEDALRSHLGQLLEAHGDAENRAAAREILALVDAPRTEFASDEELVGDWRVRSLQADALGAYVYPYFPARIYEEGEALVFEKDSGSQRHRGLMARAAADRYFFAGALYYGYQEPRLHSAHMAPDADADPEMDATALIYKLGPEHYMMAFDYKSGRFRFYEIRK